MTKVYGEPAASEWIDIESNALGGPPTEYVVPPGKVLVGPKVLIRKYDDFMGAMNGRLLIDGVIVESITFNPTETTQSAGGTRYLAEGTTLTVDRWGGDAEPSAKFLARCWLEDLR